MRVMGFSKKWDKLKQSECTTFRFPRKDRDWQIGERVQVVYHPRSKDREFLFLADIINVEKRCFDPAFAPPITNEEAITDGFPLGINEMRHWLEKSHGHFHSSRIFNRITLKRVDKESK